MTFRLACSIVVALGALSSACVAAGESSSDEKAAVKVTALAIAPNGKLLASASTNGGSGGGLIVRVWELPGLKLKFELSAEGKAIRALDFSRDNSLLCGGGDDGVVHLWSINDQKLFSSSPRRQSPVRAVLFMRRDDRVIAVSDVFQFCESAGGEVLKTSSSRLASQFAGMQLNPSGSLLAASGGMESVLLNPATFAVVQHVAQHRRPVTAQGLSSSTELLMATGHNDGTINLWHAGKGRFVRAFPGHDTAITHLAYYDRNTKLISLAADGSLHFWNLESGERIQANKLGPSSLFCLSPDRTMLVTSDGDLIHLRILDPTQPEQVRSTKSNSPAAVAGRLDPDSPNFNLLKTWRVVRGNWKQTERGFTAEGNSRIQSRSHFPSNMLFSFKMRVNGETNPRIRFDTFHFGYEGRKHRLFLHGPKATGEPVPFELGEEIAVQVRIVDDEATLSINGKEVAKSNPKATSRRFIAIEGGGRQSQGSVEFYDIELKQL